METSPARGSVLPSGLHAGSIVDMHVPEIAHCSQSVDSQEAVSTLVIVRRSLGRKRRQASRCWTYRPRPDLLMALAVLVLGPLVPSSIDFAIAYERV